MRLVWVVILLVLIGIVGVQESFAIAPSSPFSADITISHPPNLDETAEITLTLDDSGRYYHERIEEFPTTIRLPDGLELVSGELETTHIWKQGEIIEVTVTVKAIQTGNWTIRGFGFGGAADYLYLVIDENSSYIHQGNFPSSTSPKYPASVYQEYFSKQNSLENSVKSFAKESAPSPKQQMKNGISSMDVICKEGLQLWFKVTNTNPVCITEQTAEKWSKRFIHRIDYSNTDTETMKYFQSVDQRYLKNAFYCETDSDCYSKEGGGRSSCSVPEPRISQNKFSTEAIKEHILTLEKTIWQIREIPTIDLDSLSEELICAWKHPPLPATCEENICMTRYG